MDCPFCGKPLKEGNVFCETCGKEIQIVPVFEPEIEEQMQDSLDNVRELLKSPEEEAAEDDDGREEKPEKDKQKKKRNAILIVGIIGIIAVFLCSFFITQNIMQHNSYEYQMQMATKYYESGSLESALAYSQRACKIAPGSSDAKMLLAKCLNDTGNSTEAVELLEELIANDSSYQNAYRLLIELYENNGAYAKINDLLRECREPSIVEQFQNYLASAPQFGEEEGTYDSVLSLKILASGNGKVYYTLDGGTPDTSSEEYLGPIRLENGTYQVRAIFVNDYGVSSDVSSGTYVIELAPPDEPEISVESGTYQSPQMIETYLADGFEIYYTTDGSEPNRNSNPYLVPIPMPLGYSVFRFVMYNDEGVASHIATREYNLQLSTSLSVDAALILLKQALIRTGSIMDLQGHIQGMTSYKEYELTSAFTEHDQIFYLITEYITEMDQTRAKTGNQYAVNINTNEIYKASTDYAGYYVVEAFE